MMLQLFGGTVTGAPGKDASDTKYHPWISYESVFVNKALVQLGSNAQSVSDLQ